MTTPLPPFLNKLRVRWLGMDRLVRAIIFHWILGMGVGLACAAILIAIDFDGLRSLILQSDIPGAAMALLFAGFAFTFGGLVCAAAVMLMGSDDEGPRGGGGGRREWIELRPIRVAVAVPRGR